MVYMISYDLINPHQDYPAIRKEIESFGTAKKILQSTYLLKSNLSLNEIENRLEKVIDSNDRVVVCQTTGRVGGYLFVDEWSSIHSNFDC